MKKTKKKSTWQKIVKAIPSIEKKSEEAEKALKNLKALKEVWSNTISKYDDPVGHDPWDHRIGKLLGKIKNYHIWYTKFNREVTFYIVNPKTNKNEGALSGTIKNGVLNHIAASNNSSLKMDELYKWVLKNQYIKAIVADDQSEGAKRMWQRLAKRPGISIHGWKAGKPVNLDPQDEMETHADNPYDFDYEDSSTPEENDVGNTKLVASYYMRNKKKMLRKRMVKEDAPLNSAGGGAIAGIGTGPQPEPGIKRGKFAGKTTFMFKRQKYNEFQARSKKDRQWWKTYLGEDDFIVNEIRAFARRNPHEPIIIEDEDTGHLFYARYSKKKR